MVTPFLSHCRQLSYRVHLHEIKPWRSVAVAASDKFWDEKKCREFFSVRLGSLQSPQTFPDRFCKNKRQRQTNLFPLTPIITNSPVPLGVLVSVTRFFQNLATYNNENVSNSLKFCQRKFKLLSMLNSFEKLRKTFLKFCQNGEFSPILVTMVLVDNKL